MARRAATVEATRRRIVEATVVAHGELGIQATSWDEIARRAQVGVGTVYRHFPTLNELLPACGSVVTEMLALPAGDDVRRLFDGTRSTRERIERLVSEVFAVYERGAPYIDNVRRERSVLPKLEAWHRIIEDSLDALTNQALQPYEPCESTHDVVRALLDLSTWTAFKNRGLTPDETNRTVTELIHHALRTNMQDLQ